MPRREQRHSLTDEARAAGEPARGRVDRRRRLCRTRASGCGRPRRTGARVARTPQLGTRGSRTAAAVLVPRGSNSTASRGRRGRPGSRPADTSTAVSGGVGHGRAAAAGPSHGRARGARAVAQDAGKRDRLGGARAPREQRHSLTEEARAAGEPARGHVDRRGRRRWIYRGGSHMLKPQGSKWDGGASLRIHWSSSTTVEPAGTGLSRPSAGARRVAPLRRLHAARGRAGARGSRGPAVWRARRRRQAHTRSTVVDGDRHGSTAGTGAQQEDARAVSDRGVGTQVREPTDGTLSHRAGPRRRDGVPPGQSFGLYNLLSPLSASLQGYTNHQSSSWFASLRHATVATPSPRPLFFTLALSSSSINFSFFAFGSALSAFTRREVVTAGAGGVKSVDRRPIHGRE